VQWKERIGPNTSQVIGEGERVKLKMDNIMDALVANYVRLYPWFSNM